jgi:hypothetical protein
MRILPFVSDRHPTDNCGRSSAESERSPLLASEATLSGSPCGDCHEALFLINLRLQELALLVPLKQMHLLLIRKWITAQGSTARLERELVDQNEQIEDLIQLAEDWLTLAELMTQQWPNFSDLSEPIQWKLRSLGIEINTLTPSNQ